MSIKTQDIIKAVNPRFEGIQPNMEIDNVSIDSRSLQNNAGTLFFALPGQNRDGHHYIPEMIEKGVVNFVVTHIPEQYKNKANFFVVPNSLKALQDFAIYYRRQFDLPVIGITGSNGKTIVKEWLNYLLSPDYNIIRSPKSYNSQVGVPLSVIGINEKHNLGIFEAGISTGGEMEKLANIIYPKIGIFTNIGTAHDEGFANRQEKIQEKLKLFKDAEIVILQKNGDFLKELGTKKTFTWSFNNDADVNLNKKTTAEDTVLSVHYTGGNFDVTIPFFDDASVENAISCLMLLLHLGYNHDTIKEKFTGLYPVEMRLQVKNGINGCTIIDDSYSSDYQSLKIALDFLEQHKTHKKKTIILSDVFQSGFAVEELYAKVARLLAAHNIGRIIGIGETISTQLANFPNFTGYKTTQEFLAQYNANNFNNETILVRGHAVSALKKSWYFLRKKPMKRFWKLTSTL